MLRGEQLLVGAWKLRRHLGDGEWRANAGDDVFTLCIDEKLAVERALTRGRIACERDARARVVAHVAEHHRNDVDRGAEIVADGVHLSIVDGLLERPGAPHRFDGAPELRRRIHRELLPGDVPNERFVLLDEIPQRAFAQLGVGSNAGGEPFRL